MSKLFRLLVLATTLAVVGLEHASAVSYGTCSGITVPSNRRCEATSTMQECCEGEIQCPYNGESLAGHTWRAYLGAPQSCLIQ